MTSPLKDEEHTVQVERVDVVRVRNGRIGDHWGVANPFSLMHQLGVLEC